MKTEVHYRGLFAVPIHRSQKFLYKYICIASSSFPSFITMVMKSFVKMGLKPQWVNDMHELDS